MNLSEHEAKRRLLYRGFSWLQFLLEVRKGGPSETDKKGLDDLLTREVMRSQEEEFVRNDLEKGKKNVGPYSNELSTKIRAFNNNRSNWDKKDFEKYLFEYGDWLQEVVKKWVRHCYAFPEVWHVRSKCDACVLFPCHILF